MRAGAGLSGIAMSGDIHRPRRRPMDALADLPGRGNGNHQCLGRRARSTRLATSSSTAAPHLARPRLVRAVKGQGLFAGVEYLENEPSPARRPISTSKPGPTASFPIRPASPFRSWPSRARKLPRADLGPLAGSVRPVRFSRSHAGQCRRTCSVCWRPEPTGPTGKAATSFPYVRSDARARTGPAQLARRSSAARARAWFPPLHAMLRSRDCRRRPATPDLPDYIRLAAAGSARFADPLGPPVPACGRRLLTAPIRRPMRPG